MALAIVASGPPIERVLPSTTTAAMLEMGGSVASGMVVLITVTPSDTIVDTIRADGIISLETVVVPTVMIFGTPLTTIVDNIGIVIGIGDGVIPTGSTFEVTTGWITALKTCVPAVSIGITISLPLDGSVSLCSSVLETGLGSNIAERIFADTGDLEASGGADDEIVGSATDGLGSKVLETCVLSLLLGLLSCNT